jgi:DNA-binding NtrC family response regulator
MEKRILIIDDEADFCLIMKLYFAKKGYHVSVASTLSDGLSKIKIDPPEILFLDNNLPDGNGWDSIGHIVELIPHIRAFLISAHRNDSDFNKKYQNLVIWEKPISLEMLNNLF